jgi:hypothetical protein
VSEATLNGGHDPRELGRKGGIASGEARRAKNSPVARAIDNILSSRSGAANAVLLRQLGGLERQPPAPAVQHDPHKILATMPPIAIAGMLRTIGEEKVIEALEILAREEEEEAEPDVA